MPMIVRALGYAGLIPFVGLAGLAIALPEYDEIRQALELYAFGIVSFLCGAWWPTADMSQAKFWRILLSNILFLIALFSLLLLRAYWLPVAAVLMITILMIEQRTHLLPPTSSEYWRLRQILTAVASVSLLAVWLLSAN